MQHTLIVGTTGAGKSYLERMMIERIIARGDARLALIDPKRTELWDWADSPQTLDYGDCPVGHWSTVSTVYAVMNQRFRDMRQRHIREWDGAPLVLFVDEAGALMNDKKHRRGYLEMLGDVAMMGRSAGVSIVWCTQVPTRQNIPNEIRDNFPAKVCLRLDDMDRARFVLGSGREYADLPRVGQCYCRTPDMMAPQRMAVDGHLLDTLGL